MSEESASLRFFTRTSDAWDAMYEDCAAAEKSVAFEQYIMRDDRAGHRFLRLFADKARRGVRVHLILDQFGSRRLARSPLVREIREAGGRVTDLKGGPYSPYLPGIIATNGIIHDELIREVNNPA